MPAGPADIGIVNATGVLLQNIEYEGALSEVMRMGSEGEFAVAHAFDPIFTGSLSHLGTSETDIGVAASGITGITAGITVFTETSHAQVNDNYDETTVSFENAPGAEAGAAS